MKILKRIAAGVLAATITVGSLTVGASAASAKMKLRTVSIEKIEGASAIYSLGNGYYHYENSTDPNLKTDIDGIVYIGEKEIENWQKTGKFSYRKVKTDLDMTDLLIINGFKETGNYAQLAKCDANKKAITRYIVKYDENHKITTAYKRENFSYYQTRPDGYSVGAAYDNEKKTLTYTVTTPKGKDYTQKLTYKGMGKYYGILSANTGTGKYVGYILWQTDDGIDSYAESGNGYVRTQDFATYQYSVYGIKKDGKLDTLYRWKPDKDKYLKTGCVVRSMRSVGENSYTWMEQNPPLTPTFMIYLADSDKIIQLMEEFTNGDGIAFGGTFGGISGKIYNGRAVAEVLHFNYDSSTFEKSGYALIDLNESSKYGERGISYALSGEYQSMSTEDGKIYLVKNAKGERGYINRKGKELAFFEYAGSFIGDYAPVVKNGKAYLIDRNMKQVSEKIDADSVSTLGEGLFRVTKGDKVMLMTYKK